MAIEKLALYKSKRNFSITSEPAEGGTEHPQALSFVVQKHWATHLHYDFRLELDGVMLSWAVPKGPSYDPKDKRLAAHVEDHPISYSSFEGTIPAGQYGAGKVIVWDDGTWHPLGDAHDSLRAGNLKFELRGHKLKGKWALVRMKGRGEKQEPWLLIKERDDLARPASEFSVVDEFPDSVKVLAARKSTVEGPAAARRSAAQGGASGMVAVVDALADPGASAPPARVKRAAQKPRTAGSRSELPDEFSPQLATLVDAPPGQISEWSFEIKWDGYRLLARVEGKDIRLVTRNGNDWTSRLKSLHAELVRMALPDGWYDGEIVVLNDKGVPDFGALQNAFDGARGQQAIIYFVFDAPYLDGSDVRAWPLADRRAALQSALAARPSKSVRFSEAFDAPPENIVASACQLGLEGVIGKRIHSVYRSSRSADWIKLKCAHRQEFVVGGWTDPKASRVGIGSLLLGVQDGGELRYAGNVGAGFDSRTLPYTRARLDAVAAETRPFAKGDTIPGRPHWVRPELVAEVTFGEWTSAGHIRHAVFHGLRLDKDPATIVREKAAPAPRTARRALAPRDAPVQRPSRAASPAKAVAAEPVSHALNPNLRITHPERIIDSSSGITKLELVRYYGLVGKLMMEHLQARPVSLVRAPAGVDKQLFFQKHAEVEKLPGIAQLDPKLDPEHPPMLEIESADGLLSAAQWNVVEFHTQNARAADYEHPDRMVFDLDPGEGVTWKTMQESAGLMRSFLVDLGFVPFLKTSGGKGLHIVVPLRPRENWDEVKAFSKAVVDHVSKTLPQLFVNKSGGKNRIAKVYVDYLRNGRGSTTACAWSARSRPGIGISVPVQWEELASLRGGDHWTIRTAHTRLDAGNDPWKGYARAARWLAKASSTLGISGS